MASPKRAAQILVNAACAATLLAATGARAQQAPNIIRDTEIEEVINAEARPVLIASGLNPADVHIYLVGDKELNAFSAGGQNIFLNTGMITETHNPNELLGVIAHEAGHISAGHLVRNEMQMAGMKPFLLTMGLGLLAAAVGRPDAAGALIVSSPEMGALGAAKYSRSQEGAADQAGAAALERAGISGKGLADFLDEYRYEEVFEDAKKYEYFLDHPISAERVDSLRKRVESAAHYNVVDSPEAIAEHEVIKAKLSAFLDPPQQTFLKYGPKDRSFIARYARAIAYYQATEPQEALKALDDLLKDYPDNPYVWELKGQVLFETGRAAEAEPAHRRSLELKPDAPLLMINLSQTLIAENNPAKLDEAVLDLHKALALEKDEDATAWRLLAQAYDAKNMPGEARLAAAEEHFVLGELNDAKAFAMRAREQLKRNTPDWRRATDIVLVASPTQDDLKQLARSERGDRSD